MTRPMGHRAAISEWGSPPSSDHRGGLKGTGDHARRAHEKSIDVMRFVNETRSSSLTDIVDQPEGVVDHNAVQAGRGEVISERRIEASFKPDGDVQCGFSHAAVSARALRRRKPTSWAPTSLHGDQALDSKNRLRGSNDRELVTRPPLRRPLYVRSVCRADA